MYESVTKNQSILLVVRDVVLQPKEPFRCGNPMFKSRMFLELSDPFEYLNEQFLVLLLLIRVIARMIRMLYYDSDKLVKLRCIIWIWQFHRKKQSQIMQNCKVNMKK